MKGFGKVFLLGAAFLLIHLGAAIFVSAQGAKPKPQVKTPPATKAVAAANLPKVTQIDIAGMQNLLKREGENPKPLLINFWATWCDPCREEFPDLVKIDEEFKGKIDFITISLDDLAEIDREVPKFLGQMKAEMPAYLLKTPDEDAAITMIDSKWGGGLPFTILYNAKGETAYSRRGIVRPDVLRAELEKVVGGEKIVRVTEQQIIDLPINRSVYTYEKGVADARQDVLNGKLLIKRYGLTPGIAPESLKNLKKKYGVEIVEHGCLVVAGFPEYVRGYNETSRAEIKRKFGDKIAKEIGVE